MPSESDPKQTLLKQIRELRAQLDPDVMRRVQAAAVRSQFGEPTDQQSNDPNLVPIDREAASEAVARFLAHKDDNGEFQRRLVDRLRGRTH